MARSYNNRYTISAFGGPYRSQTCLNSFADCYLIDRPTVHGGNNLTWTSNYILMRYAFYQLKYVAMVCVVGLEPTTHGLKGRYSTNWVIHTLVDPQRIELHPSVLQTDVRTSYTKDPKYNIYIKIKPLNFYFQRYAFNLNLIYQ